MTYCTYQEGGGAEVSTTKTEWTNVMWGPITGCTKAAMEEPLDWCKPRRVLVCPISDLFHEGVPDEFIDRVFAVMALCPQHTFHVLTKRPYRMATYLSLTENVPQDSERAIALWDAWGATYGDRGNWKPEWPLRNLWLGTSVEDQTTANKRIPHLLKCPAALRFVSVEPMLGPVDLGYPVTMWPDGPPMCCKEDDCGCGGRPTDPPLSYGLDWVLCGAESGPNRRPCKLEWVRNLRHQCVTCGIPFFLKQLELRRGTITKMPKLDGRVWDQMPEESK